MEYTVKKLSTTSGVSSRTLRYYDQIGLLKPCRVSSNGYRIYGEEEVKKLQQILFYKEFGLDLHSIKKVLSSSSYDELEVLNSHMQNLTKEKERLEILINNLSKTIGDIKGEIKMKDGERFKGLKKAIIDENEKKYGKEIREKYGDKCIDECNQKIKNTTLEEYKDIEELGKQIIINLKEAYKTGNPQGELAQKVARMHKEWIKFYWNSYSEEAHANVAKMYVEDERFKAYYDKNGDGLAEFLRDAVLEFTGFSNK